MAYFGAPSGEYLTFQQALQEGGHVKKGEKGQYILFWTMDYMRKSRDEAGNVLTDEDGKERRELVQYHDPVLKGYYVFEVSQCEGIERKYTAAANDNNRTIKAAEDVASTYIEREKIGFAAANRAAYSPSLDKVVIPDISTFVGSNEYYSALFHELTHSTGHYTRLARFPKEYKTEFGSCDYSREELIAEMGAAFLCALCGVDTSDTFDNSAAYLEGWSKALKEDNGLILTAASRAQKAVEYILNGKSNDNE